MSVSHTFQWYLEASGRTINKTKAYSQSAAVTLDESIADSQTDYEIGFDLDVSAVESFMLVSDQDVLVEINDNAGGDGSISLVANVPYIYTSDSYDSFLFAVDMTALFVTNASGSAARLQIEALVDPTPP